MTTKNPKDTLDRLEHLMYGYNYAVSFGIDLFEDCKTLGDFYSQLILTTNIFLINGEANTFQAFAKPHVRRIGVQSDAAP